MLSLLFCIVVVIVVLANNMPTQHITHETHPAKIKCNELVRF